MIKEAPAPSSARPPSLKPRRFDSNPTPRQNNPTRSIGQIPKFLAVVCPEFLPRRFTPMKRLLPYVALAAALFLLTNIPQARAYPKPSVNKVSWELDFQYATPTRITVKVPGSEAPKAYWYMPFTVT